MKTISPPPLWATSYPATLAWNAAMPVHTVDALLDRAADTYPNQICMDFLGRTYTYAETRDAVNRIAEGLQERGVRQGTRVGLCLPNSPYFVLCYYAVLKAGGTVVNINPLYTSREMADIAEDSETEIIVTLDIQEIYSKVAPLPDVTPVRHIVVCPIRDILTPLKGVFFCLFKSREIAKIPEDAVHVPFVSLADTAGTPEPQDIDPETDIAVLQYTGGTTGTPKAAMLSHANVTANAYQVRSWCQDLEDGKGRILTVLPLFHAFAMTVGMNMGIASGATLILLPRFNAEDVLKTIHAKKPTHVPAVPTIFTALMSVPEFGKYDLSSVRSCISGGAPLPIDIKERFEAASRCTVVEGYGLSEASPVLTCNPLGPRDVPGGNKSGSIGIPLPGTSVEIRSVDNPLEPVKQGDSGEICARGPQVMSGYWNREEDTRDIFVGGFLRTGDVGYMDEDGYIFVIDRIKDVILSGGYNVYPRGIEEAIHQHSAVQEVIVIGVADAYRGEAPKAYVKLHDGEHLEAKDLIAFLTDKLSPIEIPTLVEFRDELPKTMIGKPSKKALVEEQKNAPVA